MIKFYLAPYKSPTQANYQQVASLATGFQDLNIPFTGNINYWIFNGVPLIKASNAPHEVGIYTFQYILEGGCVYPGKKILLDFSDPGYPSIYDRFDLVLRTHCISESGNVKAWIFTLPPQIINAINSTRSRYQENGVFVSFRVDHPVRSEEVKRLISECKHVLIRQTEGLVGDSLWEQTGRRYCPDYTFLLNRYKYTLAVGGYYKGGIQQWDSWRFWEAMLSDSIPLHFDLPKHGAKFPAEITPIANTHYIAVDQGYNFSKFTKKNLEEISGNGVEFVSQQCSPENLAKVFLSWI